MPKGTSLHIGLNSVDSNHYQGWAGNLRACENDANAMQRIAADQGFNAKCLLTRQATSDAVIAAIQQAARDLEHGDFFLLSYSGHGGQIPDVNGDEGDGLDETWVLYDRMLVDDELYGLWSEFKPGVRIFVLSDSCHSGTVARAMLDTVADKSGIGDLYDRFGTPLSHPESYSAFRAIPENIQLRTYQAHQQLYNQRQFAYAAGDKTPVPASVLLLSGCQDNQTSADGTINGLFTSVLLKIWNDGRFKGDYRTLWKTIVAKMPPFQTPNYYKVGTPNILFEKQEPFTVAEARPAIRAGSALPTVSMHAKATGVAAEGSIQCFLDVPQVLLGDLSEERLRYFLQQAGTDTLLDAYRQARSLQGRSVVSEAREAASASISCTGAVTPAGSGVSCTGTVTIPLGRSKSERERAA